MTTILFIEVFLSQVFCGTVVMRRVYTHNERTSLRRFKCLARSSHIRTRTHAHTSKPNDDYNCCDPIMCIIPEKPKGKGVAYCTRITHTHTAHTVQ